MSTSIYTINSIVYYKKNRKNRIVENDPLLIPQANKMKAIKFTNNN